MNILKTSKITFINGMGIFSNDEFEKSRAILPHPGSNRKKAGVRTQKSFPY